MAKFFIVSDVHSFYKEMMSALDSAGFNKDNKNHIFVSCGDLLDRGPDPISCLKFVNSLPEERKILIKGNHEDLLLEAAKRGYFLPHDYHNRTVQTAEILSGVHLSAEVNDEEILDKCINNPLWEDYINSCFNYYEDSKHIFVHGWIPFNIVHANNSFESHAEYNPEWRKETDWYSALWSNGMLRWAEGVIEPNKTIYCGHYHASWGHHHLHNDGPEWDDYFYSKFGMNAIFTPFEDKGICCLDACTAYSGFVNCKVIGKVKKPVKENYHKIEILGE